MDANVRSWPDSADLGGGESCQLSGVHRTCCQRGRPARRGGCPPRPHRPGQAGLPHPVPRARVSLTMSWTTISAVLHTGTRCSGRLLGLPSVRLSMPYRGQRLRAQNPHSVSRHVLSSRRHPSLLMQWSGRAPAPPASAAEMGRLSRATQHVGSDLGAPDVLPTCPQRQPLRVGPEISPRAPSSPSASSCSNLVAPAEAGSPPGPSPKSQR